MVLCCSSSRRLRHSPREDMVSGWMRRELEQSLCTMPGDWTSSLDVETARSSSGLKSPEKLAFLCHKWGIFFFSLEKPDNFDQISVVERASQVALVVKTQPASARDLRNKGSIPGSGRSPGGGHSNQLQYSCLENPMDRGALQAPVHGAAKNRTQLKWLSKLYRILSWKD